MITEKMIEAAAWAMFVDQYPEPHWTFKTAGPEVKSIYRNRARAALEAAERAAVSEEPVAWQNRWRHKDHAWSEWEYGKSLPSLVLDQNFEGEVRPLYTRPLPSPPEAPKGEE